MRRVTDHEDIGGIEVGQSTPPGTLERERHERVPIRRVVAKRPAAENVQRLEEIRVFGNGDPEDYVALKPAPMLVFRALLERQRPMTPKEIAQAGLCFIGLCSIYAPDGAPIEDTPEQRAERRKNAPPSQLRGTL